MIGSRSLQKPTFVNVYILGLIEKAIVNYKIIYTELAYKLARFRIKHTVLKL